MKKKVLFIADHLKGGGAERILLEVADGMLEKYSVSIALMDSTDIRMHINPQIKVMDLNIHENFMSGGLWKRRRKQLKQEEIARINQLVASENPDLIILSHWYAIHLAVLFTNKTWVWIHGDIFQPIKKETPNLFRWYKETRNHYYAIKYFSKTLDGKNLILVNNSYERIYTPFLPHAKFKTIYNGINIDKFSAPVPIEKKWDCIFVGRLSKEKQPDYALLAFAQSNLEGRMAIVGDGSMMQSLKSLAQKLGVHDRVDFVGWVTNVQEYIAKSHVLIMSSAEEGFGLVIAEALSLRTPVVAFNCSDGVYFQLKYNDLKRGLVEPQNLTALAETLKDVYQHPYTITNADIERLSIKRMLEEFDELF